MKISELIKKVNITPLNNLFDRDITGVFVSDMVSDLMAFGKGGNLWITIQTHKKIISVGAMIDVSAIIIARDKQPLEEVIEAANLSEITVFTTGLSTYDLCHELYEAGIR
ncbi:MAG: hypothetical protein JXA60_06300 [Candidatus Coatesbacteria bacterium]|nr:hypothetical protein [Candidatus Coatesbacteria bacterium]